MLDTSVTYDYHIDSVDSDWPGEVFSLCPLKGEIGFQMADLFAIHSMTVEDADGDRVAVPVYVKFPDSTTFSALAAALAVEVDDLDAITEGKIISQTLTISFTLPGTLKADAVANSDVELAGLLTFVTDAPNGKALSQAIPAYIHDGFSGDTVLETNTDFQAWRDLMLNTGRTTPTKTDDWAYAPVSFRRGKKVTRKHS